MRTGKIIQAKYSLSAAHLRKLNLLFFTWLKSYRGS